MKRISLSILCMLCCGIMAMAVPVNSAGFGQVIDDFSASIPPMFTVSSDNIKCTVTNDEIYPWIVNEKGEVTSVNKANNSESKLHFSLSSTKPFFVNFEFGVSSENYDKLHIYVDRYHVKESSGSDSGSYESFLFLPSSSIKFTYQKDKSVSFGEDRAWFKNLKFTEVDSMLTDVNVLQPGSMGNEILAQNPTLSDVKALKVSGSLNSADWALFRQMPNLMYLDIEEISATEIPAKAFAYKTMRMIKFPANLRKIGENAFYDCSLSGELVLPASLEIIGENAFSKTYITSVAIPRKTQMLGKYTFSYCYSLEKVILTDAHKSIPAYFCLDCKRLVEVLGTDSIQNVYYNSFYGCEKLRSMGRMKPLYVGSEVFYNAKELRTIDLSRSEHIGTSSFYECDSLDISDVGAKEIGDQAFYGCNSLGNINLQSVENIGAEAFRSCDKLKSIVISDHATSMGNYAFAYCNQLEEVTLGASLHNLASGAFYESKYLKKVICRAPSPVRWLSSDVFASNIPTSATLVVPDYAMVSYKLDPNWSKFTKVETHSDAVTDLVLSGTLDLTTNARISGAPNMMQLRNSHFSVNGNNPQNLGNYTIENDDPDFRKENPATFISRCNAMTATSVASRNYMNGGYWYYVCFPYDVKMSDITLETPDIGKAVRYYDGAARAANGAGYSWKNVPKDSILKANQGYIVQVSENAWIRFLASEETHNEFFKNEAIEIPLKEYVSESSADGNWNYIGNPYPSYFDIYHLDFSAPITVWSTYNRTYRAYSIADDNFALRPMQGFFVQRPEGVASVKFNPAGRQATDTIDHSYLPSKLIASVKGPRYLIDLQLSDGCFSDQTRIVCNTAASDGYETMTDAAKMMSSDLSVPQLYSWTAEADYAINEGPQADGIVNLGIYLPTDGAYTFMLNRAEMDVELLDLQTGTSVDLSEPYSFTGKAGIQDNRFCLKIKASDATGVENVDALLRVAPAVGGLRVAVSKGSRVKVHTIDGRQVAVQTLKSDNQFIVLPAGLYVVEANGQVVKALVH